VSALSTRTICLFGLPLYLRGYTEDLLTLLVTIQNEMEKNKMYKPMHRSYQKAGGNMHIRDVLETKDSVRRERNRNDEGREVLPCGIGSLTTLSNEVFDTDLLREEITGKDLLERKISNFLFRCMGSRREPIFRLFVLDNVSLQDSLFLVLSF
jgi:hypothetical protein